MTHEEMKRFFRSIQFKIPMLFILLLIISLQLIVANFLTQLESQMVSNFQEQIQLQVGFLKNNVQPILAKMRPMKRRCLKFRNCYKIIQQGIVLSKFASWTCRDIFWEQRTKRNNLLWEHVQQKRTFNKLLSRIPCKVITIRKANRVIGNTFHRLIPVNSASGNPVGIISVTSNIESRYTQVKDIGVIFISSSILLLFWPS